MKQEKEFCGCSRRDFLKEGIRAVSFLTFSQVLGLSTLFAQQRSKSCIFLWMAGGPSQIDTFDPKPGAPTGGDFKAIATSVPETRICEHLPLLAKEMKDIAIIRSMTSREGNHDRARYFVHTGYAPAGVTRHPSFGSIVTSELLQQSRELPAYVSINGPAMGAGLLGVDFAPFVIRDADKPPENVSRYGSISRERFDERIKLLNVLNADFHSDHAEAEIQKKEMIQKRALDLMHSPSLSAFDLTKEPQTRRQQYGNTKIGNGCLLARRLIEKGVRFVEVEMSGWDTHLDNFRTTRELLQQLDPAFSSLIRDLRQRGLLDTTLVVWMGEFGRTPRINSKAGRDHWPQNWCVALAGGGIKGGQVIGSTNSSGSEIIDQPVTVPDLYATLCKTLGIDPNKYNSSPLGRPIKIVDSGKMISALI